MWRPHMHLTFDHCDLEPTAHAHAPMLPRYPLQDASLQRRLAALLSQLAHWCPLFADVSFLPSVAFPLLKVFRPGAAGRGSRPASAAFEATATLLSNWGCKWFVAFPHPPLGLLQRFEALLTVHDSALAAHCARWSGGAAAVAWELMSTLMTDVLDRAEWLQVELHPPHVPLSNAAKTRSSHMLMHHAVLLVVWVSELHLWVLELNL